MKENGSPAGAPAPAANQSRGNVLLVHGIFDQGAKLRFIQRDLEAAGFRCLAPSLEPADACNGLEELALRLKERADAVFGPDEPLAIVAFSMGGLVARYYLQEMGGARRCVALFCISTPHRGTLTAWLNRNQGGFQMRFRSEFLTALDADCAIYDRIPVTCYRTPLDLMILPSRSSHWDIGENVICWQASHHLMVRCSQVRNDIVRKLQEAFEVEQHRG